MTPEGKVKAKVKNLLFAYNVYYHMPVQNGMGAPSLDFICCAKGHYFAVETKAGDKQPTPRQQDTMHKIQRAGGKCFLVNEKEGMYALEEWLQEVMG